jgi:hypothetical protein
LCNGSVGGQVKSKRIFSSGKVEVGYYAHTEKWFFVAVVFFPAACNNSISFSIAACFVILSLRALSFSQDDFYLFIYKFPFLSNCLLPCIELAILMLISLRLLPLLYCLSLLAIWMVHGIMQHPNYKVEKKIVLYFGSLTHEGPLFLWGTIGSLGKFLQCQFSL